LQLGGMSCASHCGAVYVPLQPPLQLTFAPHMTIAPAASVQLPVQVPVQLPPHEPFAVAVQLPVQVPAHVPMLAVPLHMPMHMPPQVPENMAEQDPLHSAEQVP